MALPAEKLNKGLTTLQQAKNDWRLIDDGDFFTAGNSLLQPVLFEHRPAMLKIPLSGKAHGGFRLLDCWNGKAAVNVYKYDANALLMERAVGDRSLRRMVLDGHEEEANTLVCSVVNQLHSHACTETSGLAPLASWFRSLEVAATTQNGPFAACHAIAGALILDQRDIVALHGDVHYDNILDSGRNGDIHADNIPDSGHNGGNHDDNIPDSGHRGWVAIDPKGAIGERGFDFANLFCNPNIEIAASPARLPRQVPLVAALAGLEPSRLLRWIIAWSGLMAAWMLEDGEEPTLPLLVAQLAMKELEIS
jgi:streptomycin 6-kinase